MTENHKARIDAIIQNGYEFKLGDYISRGFEILQKELGMFILFSVIFFAISIISQIIPIIGPLANSFILTPPLIAGAFIAAHAVNKGERIEFGTFFRGFDFMGQLALVVLVTSLIYLVCFIPFFASAIGSGIFEWFMAASTDPMSVEGELPPFSTAMFIGFLISMVLVTFLGVAFSWASMFVVFYKMNFWDALDTSRKLITKNWFMVFIFTVIIGLIAGLGVILLCVGLLATVPAALCMQYAAFSDITKLNEIQNPDDMIDQHLIVD